MDNSLPLAAGHPRTDVRGALRKSVVGLRLPLTGGALRAGLKEHLARLAVVTSQVKMLGMSR